MCGIVGVLTNVGNSVSAQDIKRMLKKLSHRGPDDQGIFTDENIGLGHARLAIIDLTPRAHEPMVSKDGRYVLVYNGEIYNFMEIRAELQTKGYLFFSDSDAEVVLNAYIEYKEKCLDIFNGMFAFAIFDRKEKTLFLARDRYGIKPVYYYKDNAKFIFASEVKAIFEWNFIKKEIDLLGLDEYITFQNILTDRTLYEGIRILKAGHYMIIKATESEIITHYFKYWDYNFHEEEKITFEEAKEELKRRFITAVKRQLISDVPVGAYLSGGMDSGSIVAVASRSLRRLKTFTCGFDLTSVTGFEAGFDERPFAEMIANEFGTEHYEVVLHSGDMLEVMNELVYHLDYPRLGMSYPNYYVARLASKFVKVVLAGTGGDELFAGYPWRYYHVLGDDLTKDGFLKRYYEYWQRLIKDEEKEQAYLEEIYKKIPKDNAFNAFRSVFNGYNFEIKSVKDMINASLYFEIKTFLHGLLVIEDKISMAHSLETRVPFLDNDLVEFSMRIPLEYKLRDFTNIEKIDENELVRKIKLKKYVRSTNGKFILREMMRNLLPKRIVERDKQGFSPPDASWYRGETLKSVIIKLPLSKNLRRFFKGEFITQVINQHMNGVNKRLLLWSFLNLVEL